MGVSLWYLKESSLLLFTEYSCPFVSKQFGAASVDRGQLFCEIGLTDAALQLYHSFSYTSQINLSPIQIEHITSQLGGERALQATLS